jgi:hypothetical protein
LIATHKITFTALDSRAMAELGRYDHEMALFDESIKREFPEHNGPEDIETALDAMRELKRPECDAIALSPVSKAPAQVIILLQAGLRRTIELTEAAIREINLRNLVSTALLSRGTLETASLLWDVMNAIEEVVASGDRAEVKRLLETLSKSLLGGKANEVMIDETIEARNVITIIQRLSKKFDVPLFGFFEKLSEYAHPNYHGMMATYTEAGAEGGIKAFCDGSEQRTCTPDHRHWNSRDKLQHHYRIVQDRRGATRIAGGTRGKSGLRSGGRGPKGSVANAVGQIW